MFEFLTQKCIAAGGLVVLLAVAWGLSSDRRRFPWRIVLVGLSLQFGLAALVILSPQGRWLFEVANTAVAGFQTFVNAGSSMVFGLPPSSASEVGGNQEFFLSSFAFGVLPTVIVFSSLMAVLYHLGIMQWFVRAIAWCMQRTLGTSGPETLAAAANIFVGHTEAPLVVRPYLDKLSRSELNALMVGGFATVTGSLVAAYAELGVPAGHIITASVISGPAALLIAKVMQPEAPDYRPSQTLEMNAKSTSANLVGAAAQGASDGLKLALNIAAMLIAFLALLALADYAVGQLGWWIGFRNSDGQPTLSFTVILATLFTPVAWLLGIPWNEAFQAGELLGVKMFANEFVAFKALGENMSSANPLSDRTRNILTYALCGFSNFSAIGIQVGGIGGLAPDRKDEIAQLGLRAMLGGTIACLMTACVASILM
ncbi:MAG: nucleoside transporter C-terminal domain-containing protein [Pirellulaceae bacterium]